MQGQLLSWFLEGGSVSVPKRLFALMEPLGLSFDDMGKLMYLLSLEGRVEDNNQLGVASSIYLEEKGFVTYDKAQQKISYEPLMNRILTVTGLQVTKPGDLKKKPALSRDIVDLINRFEKDQARFLSLKEKQELSKAMQQYNWSIDLLYHIYSFYLKNYRRQSYAFPFFAQMAYSAKVCDEDSFKKFCENLDKDSRKVRETLKRLGKYNNPSEGQKEMYAKWHHTWKFTHEMILLATDDTVSADNPSFGYLDQILASWRDQGITSPDEVVALRQEKNAKRKISRQQLGKAKTSPGNRLDNPGGARDLNYLEE